MKLIFPCSDCWIEYSEDNRTEMVLNDGGVYDVYCSKGHSNTQFIKNEKYELLFDLGVMAIDNSFYRESVSSFAASLERFYEYCIKVMLIAKGRSINDINETWKSVSNMSERQIGAFYMLFLYTFDEVPLIFKNKMITFRNRVVHKGYIPTKNEVLKYANEVHTYITSYLILFNERIPSGIDNYVLARKSELVEKYNKSNLHFCKFGTILSESATGNIFDFDKAVYYLTKGYFPIYVK